MTSGKPLSSAQTLWNASFSPSVNTDIHWPVLFTSAVPTKSERGQKFDMERRSVGKLHE